MGDKDDKKDDKKKKEEPEEVDMRLEFILNYLIKAMRLKQEKWNKMILIDDNKVSAGFDNFQYFKFRDVPRISGLTA